MRLGWETNMRRKARVLKTPSQTVTRQEEGNEVHVEMENARQTRFDEFVRASKITKFLALTAFDLELRQRVHERRLNGGCLFLAKLL